MANRFFVGAVLILWLGSMSWLMVDKVLPSFHDGEPPVVAGFDPGVPVAWKVYWSGRPVGYAASLRTQGVQNTMNVENRVVLEDVPLLDLVPAIMRQVVGQIGSMKLDAYTRLEFDSLDNFASFESRMAINDVPSVLRLNGRVNGSSLDLKIRFGDVTYSPSVPIPDQAALSEALCPDAKLPYMYVGRRWHEETYNPFRSPNFPVETVDVEVAAIESLEFEDRLERVMRVEYRGPASPGIPEEARLQATAWVRAEDGLVLRQDVYIAASKLRFERLSEADAADVGRKLLVQTLLDQGAPPRDGRGRDESRRRRGSRGDQQDHDDAAEPRAAAPRRGDAQLVMN